jgi:phage pi2 protein 07
MEIGALKRDDFQVWVLFEDAEVLVRYVSLEELREISKKSTKVSWDRRSRKTEETDSMEANRLLGRAAVRGWKDITMGGEEYPYNEENCDFLMTRWTEFIKFVNDVCVDLQALVEHEKEERKKNS